MSISARELRNHFNGRGGVRRKRTLPAWMEEMSMSKQQAKDGSVIETLVEALEAARRVLVAAIRENVDESVGFNPDDHVTVKRIDAAIAVGKAAL